MTTLTDPLGNQVRYEYDALGRKSKEFDARNNATSYSYDAAGHMTSVTDVLNGSVNFGYDAVGQLLSVTNPNGKTTHYTYNAVGQLLTKSDPLGRTQQNSYDSYGRLVTSTDAISQTLSYNFDVTNRLTTLTTPDGAINYSYDALDRLTSVTAPNSTINYSYDAASRITNITTPQGSVDYGYDVADQRTSMTLPGNRSISYLYNNLGRLQSVSDWLGNNTNFGYDADGNLTAVNRPGNLNSSYGYDNAGRLTSINHTGNGSTLLNFNYTLDANGNRTAVTSNLGNESYTLDALNRLTQVAYSNGDSASYSYDAAGNRLSQTLNGATTHYSYDDAGQLLSDGNSSYGYDLNGNLTSVNHALGNESYTWNWANQLVASSVGGTTTTYSYDGVGIRVGESSNGVPTNYLWDRLAQLPLLLSDGNQSYVHGIGGIAQIDANNNRQTLLPDGLGSIRGIADSSSALIGQASYGVFGALRSQSGATSLFGFTGELFSAQSGLLHLRTRDYNPVLGRFLSADRVQPNAPGSQGYNLYAYVANNPTTWVDPSGFSYSDPLSHDNASIIAGQLLSADVLGGIAGAFAQLALLMACMGDPNCKEIHEGNLSLIELLGSAVSGMQDWNVALLEQAGLFPLAPNAPLPLQFLSDIGLSIVGLDFLLDGLTLLTGRDPYTGEKLTWGQQAIVIGALILPAVTGVRLIAGYERMRTMRIIGEVLGHDEHLLIRPRGYSSDFMQFIYRKSNGRWLKPKPSLKVAQTVWGKNQIIDTGLRYVEEVESKARYWTHSDYDIQLYLVKGVPTAVDDNLIYRLNEALGADIFQHPDNWSGVLGNVDGAKVSYFLGQTIRLDSSGLPQLFSSAYKAVWDLSPETFKAVIEMLPYK